MVTFNTPTSPPARGAKCAGKANAMMLPTNITSRIPNVLSRISTSDALGAFTLGITTKALGPGYSWGPHRALYLGRSISRYGCTTPPPRLFLFYFLGLKQRLIEGK